MSLILWGMLILTIFIVGWIFYVGRQNYKKYLEEQQSREETETVPIMYDPWFDYWGNYVFPWRWDFGYWNPYYWFPVGWWGNYGGSGSSYVNRGEYHRGSHPSRPNMGGMPHVGHTGFSHSGIGGYGGHK